MNAKLERPLDSQAPQTEQVYAYVADDWGDGYEDEYDPQWDNTDSQWESSDNNGYDYGDRDETYTAEAILEEEEITGDQNQDDREDYDEDDQDKYM